MTSDPACLPSSEIELLTSKINELRGAQLRLESKLNELESKKKKTKQVDEPVQCEICGKTLKNRYTLKTHIANRHTDNRERFKCSICGKDLKSKYYLQYHINRIHRDEINN